MTGQQLYERLYDAYVNGTIGAPTIPWTELSDLERAEWDRITREDEHA